MARRRSHPQLTRLARELRTGLEVGYVVLRSTDVGAPPAPTPTAEESFESNEDDQAFVEQGLRDGFIHLAPIRPGRPTGPTPAGHLSKDDRRFLTAVDSFDEPDDRRAENPEEDADEDEEEAEE